MCVLPHLKRVGASISPGGEQHGIVNMGCTLSLEPCITTSPHIHSTSRLSGHYGIVAYLVGPWIELAKDCMEKFAEAVKHITIIPN